MLEHLGAEHLANVRTSARLDEGRRHAQLVLELNHVDREILVEAYTSHDEIIVLMSEADAWSYHWHFAPTWNDVYGSVAGRAWTSLAVDFLAELLHGEVRVRATYGGDHLLKVHAEVVGSDGHCFTAGTTGALTARALNFWAKRRVEERIVRFAQ